MVFLAKDQGGSLTIKRSTRLLSMLNTNIMCKLFIRP